MKRTSGITLIVAAAFVATFAMLFALLSYPLKYRDEIVRKSKEFDVSAALVASVVYAESKFHAEAVSARGAVGLMQLMPTTAEDVAKRLGLTQFDLQSPVDNITLGTAYLKMLLTQFGGNLTESIAAYNAGPGRVEAWLRTADYAHEGRLVSIPYPETDGYVKKVKKAMSHYEKKFANP